MFNEMLVEIENDLAIEGENGLSWNAFWTQLEKLVKESTEKVKLYPLKWDTNYKKYIWDFIKSNKNLLFYSENEPIDIEPITFENAESMINSIKTRKELQDDLLYGVVKPNECKFSNNHKILLRHIAKKKYQGITQYDLSAELEWDPRTTFYYLKKLLELNLVVRQSVYIAKTVTNMLYFHRFVPDKINNNKEVDLNNTIRIDVFDKKLLDLLQNAQDNMMSLKDIITKMDIKDARNIKWIQARIIRYHEQGILEKVIANDGNTKTPCVRLISSTASSCDNENKTNKVNTPIQDFKVYRDLPIECQIYQYVLEANEKGAAKQELLKRFPHLKWTFISSYLDSMCDAPDRVSNQHLIYRTEELDGKVRQFRYISSEAYHKLEQNLSHLNGNNKRQREEAPKDKASTSVHESNTQAEPPRKQAKVEITSQQEQVNQSEENQKRVLCPESITKNNAAPKKRATKINTTKLRRQQIILDMLEKNHICEINTDLINEFNKIEEAASGQKMARKTFRNMANDLSSEGKLKIVTSDVPMKFGMVEYKTFLLHSSLNEHSKEFIDVLEKYKSGWNVNNTSKLKEFREISVEKTPNEDSETTPKSVYEGNIKHALWRPVAVDNGWISSKWLRAREIHIYLFDRFIQTREQNPNLTSLESTDFVSLMPLDILIKIFASLSIDNEILEFIKLDTHRALCVKDLPPNIQNRLDKVHRKLRSVILSLLDSLEALELIKQTQTNHKLTFEIKQEAHIYNYSKSPPLLLETVALQNREDLNAYWSKLKSYYVEIHPFLVDKTTKPFPYVSPHPLYNITAVRAWFNEERYSDEQKTVLNSFVDYDEGTTPSSNKPLILHLAKQLHLSQDRIKSYYLSLDAAFKKKKERSKAIEEKKKKEEQTSSVIRSLITASVNKQKVKITNKSKTTPFLEPTFVGSRKFRIIKVKTKSYKKNNLDGDINGQIRFSQVEKDALLLSYAIMRFRAKDSLFYWSPIKKVFENRSPERCRRVIFHLLRSIPNIHVKLKQYQKQWEYIYKQGIQNKEIIDEHPWDTVDYDLKGQLEYFVLNLQRNMEQREDSQSIILPRNYTTLKNEFHINEYNIDPLKIHRKEGRCAMTNYSYQSIYDVPSVISRDHHQNIAIESMAIIIKMLMMLPPDIYKPDEAYEIVSKYPEDVIIKATNILQDEGVVVKERVKKGRIPGRMLRISDRFISLASGVLPFGFFDETNAFFSKIIHENQIELTFTNGSENACLLDLLSQNKIDLNIKDREKYIRLRKGLIYPKLTAVELCKSYVTSGLDLIIRPKDIATHKLDKKMNNRITPIDDITKQLLLLETQEPHITKVYHVVKSFGELGASIDEIDIECKLKGLKNAVKCCSLLASHILIKLVGMNQMRYVAYDFISKYMLSEGSRLTEPWMWCDMSGNILSPVLKGCSQAVMSHILERPGISLAELKQVLDCFFTSYELHSILEYLENGGVIKCIKLRVPSQKMSLFGKRNVPSVQKTNVKCGKEISHYWLSPNYYTKL